MPISVTADVADVLSRSTIEGTLLKLPAGQLERTLYAGVDRVLKALGGKWDRRAGGHAFPFDPAPKVAEALGAGGVVSRQQRLQLFETPVALATRLCSLLDVGPGDRCLEPSAGRGRILTALAALGPASLHAVEVDPDNAAHLATLGLDAETTEADFLSLDPASLECDAIAMNPPFQRNQDVRHVRHAHACLAPGGRLAAIVGEHGFFGRERECVEWRDWLDSIGAVVERVPAGAFSESGTAVPTRIVVLRRP